MTETVHGAPTTPGEGQSRGLRIPRVYTRPGVHPYEEITWERRDVVMTNWRDGSVNFEQRGVEFPSFWSMNATNIVASKYFRGAVGSPERESSLRQLIDRVVGTYVRAGVDNGYFATPDDAEVFEHELTHMLVHQIFSFNSPVWFNVGTSAPQQVSACFILSVDDTMESILNWYREEGLIFKGGSGAGVNLSRIRSSRELLSSGGTASGPVSFMRGADASAGTIKSGGATRRAAKMVILDVDHPDVAEFIETKAREEEKVRVLRDAGYDMDLGGRDIVSVQYQNANNSVRVTDEFMGAVEQGKPFALRSRKTGSVVETVDSRQLFRQLATAAWQCADPGIQYDDTINDWPTCPESGRITASNPCFTGATAVLTVDRGPVAFKDLVGETALVYCRDEAGNVRVSRMREIRRTQEDAEVVRVDFQGGGSVRCTATHLFMLPSGEYVPAAQLTTGQTLASWGALHTVAAVTADGREDVFDGEVDRWHNFVVITADSAKAQRGIFVHNCSEYMHLDNSSCNLASLNLLKFLRDDDTFDTERFARVVEMVITAMDISICFADFPTEAITRTTRDFRQLGIGYANLGALLMATGHAYDSEGGRSLAAAITSLMTGVAYKCSAELAGVVGPYAGFSRNAEAHKRVMRKHAAATDAVRPVDADAARILKVATQAWADCLAVGERNGWRNAQASLLAPTGTIGLAMDVDTTGVEPDLALVKFKKLVGGGSMQIINQTVPRALTKLGYPKEQAEAIIEHIAEHGNVIDAPGLRPEHYEVFDCAIGTRAISPIGHVRMMAAVQPFLSGAISKTVNVPETATVEDIEEIYFQGWKLGLKALAIYRDNCKVGQPLTDAKAASRGVAVVTGGDRPVRKRLPKSRTGETVSFSVGGAEGYMTANAYEDDGLGEIFLKMSKQGSTLAGVMDAFSIAISIALQYGVPLETYVSKFINMRFDPAGMTDDPDVRMAQSVMDYIFRRLALDYLPPEKRAELGIFTAAERAAALAGNQPAPTVDEETEVDIDALAQSAPVEDATMGAPPLGADGGAIDLTSQTAVDAPLCFTCGIKMRPAGSCYVCESCGSTSGCS